MIDVYLYSEHAMPLLQIGFYFPSSSSYHSLTLFIHIRLYFIVYLVQRHRLIPGFLFNSVSREFNKACILFWKFNKNSFDYGLNLRNELFKIVSTEWENRINVKKRNEADETWYGERGQTMKQGAKCAWLLKYSKCTSTYWIDMLHILCINEENFRKSQRIDESKQNKRKQEGATAMELFLTAILITNNLFWKCICEH